LTSSTACGNLVISVLGTGRAGSLYHLPLSAHVGASSGFSLIITRFVSSDTRTVESNGIWNAVRQYCVRIMGVSCLASIWLQTSSARAWNLAASSGLFPFALRSSAASAGV